VPSKQFAHLQEASLQRLKALVPSDCPLVVRRLDDGGFLAHTIDGHDAHTGRFQVVHAYISGYVACWRRVRPTAPTDAVSRLFLPSR
jgi:hypothetical protein